MGYFQVRYDSRVVIYDREGFIRLATVLSFDSQIEVFHKYEEFFKENFEVNSVWI